MTDARPWMVMTMGFVLPACGVIPGVNNCSDLEVGERLLVTVREPLESPACDPTLGFGNGVELVLTVEGFGRPAACTSAIGPATFGALQLDYWAEGSEAASGSGAFVSVSRNFGRCLGAVNFEVLRDEGPPDTEVDTFDRMRITYQSGGEAGCPSYCNVPYVVDVERL